MGVGAKIKATIRELTKSDARQSMRILNSQRTSLKIHGGDAKIYDLLRDLKKKAKQKLKEKIKNNNDDDNGWSSHEHQRNLRLH